MQGAESDKAEWVPLYNRLRPLRFCDVQGQEHVTNALQRSVESKCTSHTYLFSGARGTGKTSTARILAMALNCETQPTGGEPCGTCNTCIEIRNQYQNAVIEIDAASNRGIDGVRSLIQSVSLSTMSRFRVVILDEAHMLTNEASNALLKILEEPPPQVVFVLCTTDEQKLLPTIKSRSQHYRFRLLTPDEIVNFLDGVVDSEGLDVDSDTVVKIANESGGSVRDALSLIEQASIGGQSYAGNWSVSDGLADAVVKRDVVEALAAVSQGVCSKEPRVIATELISYLRNCLLASHDEGLVALPDDEMNTVLRHAEILGPKRIVQGIEELGSALKDMSFAIDHRVVLETALTRLLSTKLDANVDTLMARIDTMESILRQLTEGKLGTETPTLVDVLGEGPSYRKSEAPRQVNGTPRRRRRKTSSSEDESSNSTSSLAIATIADEDVERLWVEEILPSMRPTLKAKLCQAQVCISREDGYDKFVITLPDPIRVSDEANDELLAIVQDVLTESIEEVVICFDD